MANGLVLSAFSKFEKLGGWVRSGVICAVFVLVMGLPGHILGESAGTISGVVKDTAGVAMPDVAVHAVSQMTGTTLRAITDDEGKYRLENVAPGSWEMSFAGNGFDTAPKTVQVKTEPAVLNATLAINASAQGAAQGSQQAPMPNMPNMPAAAPAAAPQLSQELTEEELKDPKALLAHLRALEDRLATLETYAVMSVPETRTKRIEVYVDANSNEYDAPVPGTKKVVTYQRERVYRRAEVNEKIAAALSEESEKSVAVGVSAAIMPTGVIQSGGPRGPAAGRTYDLASADISFAARVAQNTTFYADLVGLTGPTPDNQIPSLTNLNSFTARLDTNARVNLREAWIRTELLHQSLAIIAGRLDLTSFIDRNANANDETRQFLSDALVNNPTLGLISNGAGVAVVYDPKRTINFKIGFQQNDPSFLNLSQSLIALAEVGFYLRPFSLAQGNYRIWGRTDNTLPDGRQRNAMGVSFDQALTDHVGLFGRFGYGYVGGNTKLTNAIPDGNMLFYSGGVQFQKRFVLYPGDTWGAGYAQSTYTSGLGREHLGEIYYNFQLTERLQLSPRVQYVREIRPGVPTTGYVLPGVRLQVAF